MAANKWTKDGSFPREMTDPMEVFRDAQGFSYMGVVGDDERLETLFGYTAAPPEPPIDPASQRLDWDGAAWVVVDVPPPPEPPAEPVRIKKFWLFQRFTEDEERRYAALEYQARNLTPAELDDPAKEPLFQIQRFDRRLAAIEFVELDAAMTLGVFELLRLLGVFGDPEAQASQDRIFEILAPPQPHEIA